MLFVLGEGGGGWRCSVGALFHGKNRTYHEFRPLVVLLLLGVLHVC